MMMEHSFAENRLHNRDPVNKRPKKSASFSLIMKFLSKNKTKANKKSIKESTKSLPDINADSTTTTKKIENSNQLRSARNSNSGLKPSRGSLPASTLSLAPSSCLTSNDLSKLTVSIASEGASSCKNSSSSRRWKRKIPVISSVFRKKKSIVENAESVPNLEGVVEKVGSYQCEDESNSDSKCVNVESSTIDEKVTEWLKKRKSTLGCQNDEVVEIPESGELESEKSTPNHKDELISTHPNEIIPPLDLVDGKEKRNLQFKILVVGELKSGKTSIINQYVHKCFSGNYQPATIGIDYCMKIIPWDEKTIITLHFWDTAGQEQFMNLFRGYYKRANGAFIVFDVTNSESFEAVPKWKRIIDSNVELGESCEKRIPCVMLANKCDQGENRIIRDCPKMDAFCTQHKLSGWLQTSAKDDINIVQAVQVLISEIMQNEYGDSEEIEEKEEEKAKDEVDQVVNLGESKVENKKKGCSC